ncbi:DUF2080 family transposase-associated protein [bacterium]|nr:DUF2080 family transposase-associated protein [bacterium]
MIARVCLARKIPTFDNNSVVDGVGNSPVILRRPPKRQSKTTFNTEGIEVIRRPVKKTGSGAHVTLPKEWLDETVVIIRTGE